MVKSMDSWYVIFSYCVMAWFFGFPGFLIFAFDNTREIIGTAPLFAYGGWLLPIAGASAWLLYADNRAWKRGRRGKARY